MECDICSVVSFALVDAIIEHRSVTVKSRGRTQTETPHQMTLDVNLSGT
jgi:hypothetical protein